MPKDMISNLNRVSEKKFVPPAAEREKKGKGQKGKRIKG
jgi:hypothetical protein